MSTTETARKELHGNAKLVSNALHPWLVLMPVLALAAYQAAGEPLEYLRWTLLAFVPALVSPFIYARIRLAVLSRGGSQQKISRSLVRDKPEQLFITAGLFGVPSALILYYLNGPVRHH